MQKKTIAIIGVVVAVLLIAGIGWFAFGRTGNNDQTAEEDRPVKRQITLPTNVIPVEERPYISIAPTSNGRFVDLTVHSVNKPADQMEYELEYQSGTLLQGVFDTLDISEIPTTKNILLGSRSAGGSTTYHEDVKGGTLLAEFSGGDEPYALKQDWKFIDNAAGDTELSSKDAKFQLTSEDISTYRYVIIYNSPGYPADAPGAIVSEVYSLESSQALTGTGQLTIRANEEGSLTIAGYDGESWTTFETTSDGKMAEAEVDLLPLYAVITE